MPDDETIIAAIETLTVLLCEQKRYGIHVYIDGAVHITLPLGGVGWTIYARNATDALRQLGTMERALDAEIGEPVDHLFAEDVR